jgi:hypothetical protein
MRMRELKFMKNLLKPVIGVLVISLGGCQKHSSTTPVLDTDRKSAAESIDACSLLAPADIEAVQGSPVKNTKPSSMSAGGMRTSQCFYTAAEFSKSVSLTVTQADPGSSERRSAMAYWKETFRRYEKETDEKAPKSENDKQKTESLREQRQKGGEEEAIPPKRISAVGDEAFWSGNRVGGALYVLKKSKDAFIRISVGGPDNEETKIKKSAALARQVLGRL